MSGEILMGNATVLHPVDEWDEFKSMGVMTSHKNADLKRGYYLQHALNTVELARGTQTEASMYISFEMESDYQLSEVEAKSAVLRIITLPTPTIAGKIGDIFKIWTSSARSSEEARDKSWQS